MAGSLKPSNVNPEITWTINALVGSQGSGGTVGSAGLFNGVAMDQWNTSNVMYWYDSTNYIDITLNSDCNIWRSGTTSWSSYKNALKIEKWNGSSWVNVTSTYPQTLTTINNTQWEKTISNLPAGRYKFSYNGSARLDSEWYLESTVSRKFLIKQNLNYYTIKTTNYDSTTTHNFTPLTLTGGSQPNVNDYNTFGFTDINLLNTSMTVGSDTFYPKDKILTNGNFDIKMYKG